MSDAAMTDATRMLRRFLLALCVWREARGETPLGRRLVATTIMNRTRDAHKRWPTTVSGVILQPWQFSSFNANDPNATQFPIEANNPTWDDCVAAADEALQDGAAPLTTANHYHVIGLNPKWADASKVVATEAHHIFYCL